MSRDQAAGRPTRPVELPPHDLPSPEVLDELLKAFSADTADEQKLEAIDLDSPEVEALIAPPSAPPDESEPEVEVEGSPDANGSSVDERPGPALEDEVEPAPAADATTDVALTEPDTGTDVAVGPDDPTAVAVQDPPAADADAPAADAPAAADDEGVEPPSEDGPGEPAPSDETVADAPAHTDAAESSAVTRTIRIDASDDPPDAVYLAAGDPLLAASAGGRGLTAARATEATTGTARPGEGTVFIDDQDVGLGETISIADASSATQIEPRMRERRIAVKRAVGRKRLRWVLVAVVVLVLVVAALAVLGSSLFAIDDVAVQGAVYTDPAALQAVVDDLTGTPVLRADTDAAERTLEAIPWVESARVTTSFPHGATIEIRERTPATTYQGPDGRFRVIDTKGRVLDVLDAQPAEYLLLVSADAPDLEVGQFAPQGFQAAASLAQALTPELRARAESVSVTPDGSDLRLMLSEGVEVRFGPARDLVTKLVRVQTRLDEVDKGGFSYVDVSTNEVTTG